MAEVAPSVTLTPISAWMLPTTMTGNVAVSVGEYLYALYFLCVFFHISKNVKT